MTFDAAPELAYVPTVAELQRFAFQAWLVLHGRRGRGDLVPIPTAMVRVPLALTRATFPNQAPAYRLGEPPCEDEPC